jgi:hypothetical protein
MFFYWNMITRFHKLYLMFVKSQREGNWHLNVAVQMKLMKFVFAFDRKNYSRWMAVSVHKDQEMPSVHPEVYEEFEDGRFVVQKTDNPFSGMPPDQAGEQCNELYKDFQGGLGSDVNKRAIVAGPVAHHLFEEFESSESPQTPGPQRRHHEDTPSHQRGFFNDVRKLTIALLQACNPFSCGKELYYVHNGQLMVNYEAIAASLRSLERIGEEQYQEFRIERLIRCVVPLDAPIQMLNLILPSSKVKPVKEKFFKGNL